MLLQKLCFLRRKLNFYLIFTVLKCNYTPFVSYVGANIKSCWSWVFYNQFQYCFDTISTFTSNKNFLVQIMNEICPVYKGMLKPIIISYKLTTCQLLYLTMIGNIDLSTFKETLFWNLGKLNFVNKNTLLKWLIKLVLNPKKSPKRSLQQIPTNLEKYYLQYNVQS